MPNDTELEVTESTESCHLSVSDMKIAYSLYMSIHLSIYLSTCQSIYLSIYLSIHLVNSHSLRSIWLPDLLRINICCLVWNLLMFSDRSKLCRSFILCFSSYPLMMVTVDRCRGVRGVPPPPRPPRLLLLSPRLPLASDLICFPVLFHHVSVRKFKKPSLSVFTSSSNIPHRTKPLLSLLAS